MWWCSPGRAEGSVPVSTSAISAPACSKPVRPAIDRLRFQEAMAGLVRALADLPQAVVAAVNGPFVGAGLALSLTADIRIGSTSATFGNAAILLGLSGAEMGMSYHLPRIVGAGVAADWMSPAAP